MAVGLLRPDDGRSLVFGIDVWERPISARRLIGVLPDGLASNRIAHKDKRTACATAPSSFVVTRRFEAMASRSKRESTDLRHDV